MLTKSTRLLAVGTAAVIALFGLPAVTPATAAAPPVADATRAANYIVRNLPSAKSDVALAATAALGLATTNDCTYAPSLRTLVSGLESKAKKYVSGQPGRAAKLSITVSALGLNPKSFGKVNLVSAITKGLPADGQVGPFESAFTQGLAIIALKRAGSTIPVTLLTKLLSLQDPVSGAFGYEDGGSFVSDPDTTAVAIVALDGLGNLDPQLDKAVASAKASQENDGYWKSFSPVDSTGLMGSALAAVDEDVTSAKKWLGTQQRPDGGFPAELSGSSSEVMATSEAMFLAKGKTLLDASLKLSKCPKNPKKLPASTTSCTGVWVVVDRANGQEATRCATKFATGIEALKSAGFSTKTFSTSFGPALCQVTGYPIMCDTTFASGYWSYWQATQKDDGTWTVWDYANTGPATSKPVKGVAEGHLWVATGSSALLSVTPPKGYSASPDPLITGTATVGQTLTVNPGTWTPSPDEVSIRWYRSGKSISGATKTTYVLTKSDYNKVITVKVTASGPGYQTVSRTSLPTAKVTK